MDKVSAVSLFILIVRINPLRMEGILRNLQKGDETRPKVERF
jgi:hypothetical protein